MSQKTEGQARGKGRAPLTLRKHEGAIHIAGRLGLVERKLSNVLIQHAYKELPDLSIVHHTIPVAKLCELAGISKTNRRALRDALKALTMIHIEWDILNANGMRNWGGSPFLAGYSILQGSGICEYQFSVFLRERLYDPPRFALIRLELLGNISTAYAIALYECCVLYKDWYRGTGMRSVMEWKKLLGVDKHYIRFKDFSYYVLKPAIRQINALTDIEIYDVQVERQDRRIVKLGFMVRTNPQMEALEEQKAELPPAAQDFDKDGSPALREAAPVKNKREPRTLTEEELALRRAMSDYGISPGRHQEILSQCSADQIRDNLAYVSAKARKGEKVKNWGAYAASAILRDYAGTQKGEPTIQREIEQQKQAEVRRRQEKARAEEARQREEDKRLEEQREWTIRAQEHFDTWPEDKQVRFDAEVRADLIAQGELDPANPYGGVLVRTTRLDRIANMLRAENGAER